MTEDENPRYRRLFFELVCADERRVIAGIGMVSKELREEEIRLIQCAGSPDLKAQFTGFNPWAVTRLLKKGK